MCRLDFLEIGKLPAASRESMSGNPPASERPALGLLGHGGLYRLYFALDFSLFLVTGYLQIVTGLKI